MSSTTTEEHIELSTIPPGLPTQSNSSLEHQSHQHPPLEVAHLTTAIPDGGYGWIIVVSLAHISFLFNGISLSWGVLQTALLNTTLRTTPTSTLSFVGSVGIAICVAFGLVAVRLMRWLGSRTTALLSVLIMGSGLVGSGFTTSNVAGMFGTSGILVGVGMCSLYVVANALPVQYFSGHLGLANGLVKLGGGVGGTVMAISLEALVRHVGVAWTFRIFGFLTIGTGIPAALVIKDRVPLRQSNTPILDLAMFKSLPFVATFIAGAFATFALFVPPYFLPLFAQSLGLSSSTGAGLVAGFNICSSIGRFLAGPLCDKIGPINMFLITMLLNAISMLAIWPVSNTLGPLVAFAMLNGIANGSFFTTLPTVMAEMFGPGRAAVAMGMTATGWTGGYLMGAPIAGYLLQASGGNESQGGAQGIAVYRPAIFYAGGVALASSLFVVIARVRLAKKVLKRV